MFLGRYIHKVDSKGRLALPIRMREAGKGINYSEFIITKGIGGCIALFPVDKFENFLEGFNPEELSPEQGLNFYREVASWAHNVSVDGQGRINLPQLLIENVGLDEEVLVLGVVDWIEIWDPVKYNEHIEKSNTKYDEGAMEFFSSLIRGKRKNKQSEQEPSERSGE